MRKINLLKTKHFIIFFFILFFNVSVVIAEFEDSSSDKNSDEKCIDSDGMNFYNKGEGKFGDMIIEDFCDSFGYLQEWYCDSDALKIKRKICPEGFECKEGRCSQERIICASYISVKDSSVLSLGNWTDNPIYTSSKQDCLEYMKVHVLDQLNCGISGGDFVNIFLIPSPKLVEENPYNDGTIEFVHSQFCDPHDGSECKDFGGRNYFEKGFVKTDVGWIGIAKDFCGIKDTPSSIRAVDSCTGENCYVKEFYCEDHGPHIDDDFFCPFGCEDAACLTSLKTDKDTKPQIKIPVNGKDTNVKEKNSKQNSIQSRNTLLNKSCNSNSDCDDSDACTFEICVSPLEKCAIVDKSNGCSYKKKCIPVGSRINGIYCNQGKQIQNQSNGNEECFNNYECSSNICENNRCLNQNFMQKIISWFSKSIWRIDFSA